MKDIEQYADSLYKLKKLEEFDININIPVVNQAFLDCIKYNTEILKTHNTPILFSNNRLIFPHITLKMGTVKSGHFENIIIKLGNLITKYNQMNLSPSPIILKPPANKYYFSEINDDKLIALSMELDELLKDDMKLPRFPLSKDNLHHITLGYKFPEDTELAPIIGQNVKSFIADRIQVSIMGKFGVCIGVLKTYYLAK